MSHNSIIRKIIVKLHLYTGLILGLIITLICLSGTAIVYKPELEKLSVKDIAFVKPASRTVSPQTLLENVRHEYPQAKINNMVLYGGEDCAYSFRTTFPDEKGRIQIYVNPYTGEVTGVDRYRHKVFQWLYDFHVNLLLKKQGATIVALSGFLLIFLTLSGFLLLPKRRIFSVNRKMGLRAKLFKSHSIIGICTSLFLLVIAFTGSYFGFKKEYQSFFESISAGKAVAPAPKTDKYTGDLGIIGFRFSDRPRRVQRGNPDNDLLPERQHVCLLRTDVSGRGLRKNGKQPYLHPSYHRKGRRHKPMERQTGRREACPLHVLCPLRHFPRALLQNPMDPHKPSRTVSLFHWFLHLGYSPSAETIPFPENISPGNLIA